ncbi:acyltransferase [Halobacillus salinarum]|uniref:Acyltransferase n=1 Tax=Halobacillus salinarum TaxID=2932257 RepID=A0ABY4EPA1_9BACI|nr:acyltransferase [Halobacillus salinarum]UOQ45693.1 acyltransferase [Halobacillus salinarum]
MAKQRITSVYFLRLIAMLCVVLVHVTGIYYSVLDMGTGAFQKYHFFNRIIRIEAGIFIMITGLVFFYNYYPKKFTASLLKDYFRKRVFFIVVPYIVWALFYELYAHYTGGRSLTIFGVLERILKGESYYQLHFIFLIVQFYIFLPLFVYLTQKFSLFKKYFWLFGILIEVGYFYLNSTYGFTNMVVFLKSFGTFSLGGWLGIYYLEQREKVYNKTIYPLGILTLIAGTLTALYYYYVYTMGEIKVDWDYYKLLNVSYLMLGGYFFFRITEILSRKLPKLPNEIVKNVALYSFGFYLVHPFILKEVGRWIPIHNNYWFHLEVFVKYIVVVVFCYLFIFTIHKFAPKVASLLFGKLPQKAVFLYERKEEAAEEKKQARA